MASYPMPLQLQHARSSSHSSVLAGSSSGVGGVGGSAGGVGIKKEIYTWEAPLPSSSSAAPLSLYSFNWSERRPSGDSDFRLAVSTFVEEYSNKVEIVQYDPELDAFVLRSTIDHPYPATKVKWIPDPDAQFEDLVATSGDYLRIWKVSGGGEKTSGGETASSAAAATSTAATTTTPALRSTLLSSKETDVCAPLTSFDWNEVDPNIIGTCSIDTTCTMWDIEKETISCQLIAHDEEVYDIAFGKGKHEFASVGGDGHIRLFDLRHLEHSTIMYESPDSTPLLRLAWNKNDPNYIAAIQMDSPNAVIIDIRMPGKPFMQLGGHSAPLTSIAWAPQSGCHICTASDDSRALIWDLSHSTASNISSSQTTDGVKVAAFDPILVYHAEAEINQLQWSKANPFWVAIVFENKLQVLRV